jgi:hypothetical protein
MNEWLYNRYGKWGKPRPVRDGRKCEISKISAEYHQPDTKGGARKGTFAGSPPITRTKAIPHLLRSIMSCHVMSYDVSMNRPCHTSGNVITKCIACYI